MSTARRSFLSDLLRHAWSIYRGRAIPGCNVRTFADAMRNAWAWAKRTALPAILGPVLQLRTMVQSPMRRAMTAQPHAFDRAYRAGRLTSRLGC